MKLGLLLVILSVGLLYAADVTGKWSGSFEMKTPEGEMRSHSAYLVLREQDGKVTGRGGPDESDLHDLSNCKLNDKTLECDVDTGNETLKIKLAIAGDVLDGTLTGPAPEGGSGTVSARLTLKRVK